MAVASGGTLIQDVTGHRLENMVYDQLPDLKHKVVIDEMSSIIQKLKKRVIEVNSAHLWVLGYRVIRRLRIMVI